MSPNTPLPHLGGISAATFLRDYWQKKPLLIRNAFPNFVAPLSKQEVFLLAARDEAESRLFTRERQQWHVEHGPFPQRAMREIRRRPDALKWTLLIQDTQHYSYEAHQLLEKFQFIGQARIDDLMVSYAVPGGGVGAHVDSYDVFLLQGLGQRRWQISQQRDLSLKPNHPVKVLKNFQPAQEWVLNTGDMLYLPPNVAHHGVAETECMTWSIGFRAPSALEISTAYLSHLADSDACATTTRPYTDAGLRFQASAARIGKPMQSQFGDMVRERLRAAGDTAAINEFIGGYLTTPKAHVFFEPPEETLTLSTFKKRAQGIGLHLDLRSRALYDERALYLNGEKLNFPSDQPAVEQVVKALRTLADHRSIAGVQLSSADKMLWTALFESFNVGYLHLGERL